MKVIMYSLYVGHYESPAITKNDVAKLNRLGLRGFVFSRGDYYSIKVLTSPHEQTVLEWKATLEKAGFKTEVESIDIKQSLHLN